MRHSLFITVPEITKYHLLRTMNNVKWLKKFNPKFDRGKRKKKHIIYNTLMSALDIETVLVLHDHQLV